MSKCEDCGTHLDDNQCHHHTYKCNNCCGICRKEELEDKVENLEKRIKRLEEIK